MAREEVNKKRDNAVLMVVENGMTIATAARVLETDARQVSEWVRVYREVKKGNIEAMYLLAQDESNHITNALFEWAMKANNLNPAQWVLDYEMSLVEPVVTLEDVIKPSALKVEEPASGPNDQLWYAKVITCLGMMSDTMEEILSMLKGMNGVE